VTGDDGRVLGGRSGNPSGNVAVDIDVDRTQDVLIRLDASVIGPLDFSLGWISADAIAPSGPDAYEHNDSFAAATPLDDLDGTLSRTAGLATLAPGEVDWYRVNTQAGPFRVSLINNAEAADVELEWYDETGTLIRGIYGSRVNETLFLNRGLDRDQPVYLLVYNNGAATGVYDLAWDFHQR